MRKPSMKGRNPASLRDGPSVTSRTRFVPSHLVSGLEMGAEGWEMRAFPPGCFGSRIPCFPSAGHCHDELAEWKLS